MPVFDIVIIGAGVIGYSIAFRLKQTRPELRIALLGDKVNSHMASRAAAGMLAPYGECEQGDRFFHFCHDSLKQYPQFVKELMEVSGVPVYISMAGSILPSISYSHCWDERLQFFRSEGISHEIWSRQTLNEKVPLLSSKIFEAIWVAEGQVNNRQMHDALVAATEKLGVHLIPDTVTGFQKDESLVRSAVTDSKEVIGKKFVLASGSWAASLAQGLGVNFPMKPVKGQMCRLQMSSKDLAFTIHGILTYIAPWGEGEGFVIGSTMEDKGFDSSIEEEVIQGLIDRASEILPCLKDAPVMETWVGFRPAAEDKMPVMGKSGTFENLYYSSGHFRNGILQTPAQADYMSACILGTLENEIPEFAPSRFNL